MTGFGNFRPEVNWQRIDVDAVYTVNYGTCLSGLPPDVSCSMLSDVLSLVLRDSDTDSKNVSLIRRSVLNGQITSFSNGVSLIGI